MLHSRGCRSEATAVVLARDYRSVWRQCLLTLLAIAFMTAVTTSYASAASEDENISIRDEARATV
ncbi:MULTISPECIES: hypothetical protein [Sinorhizobium]|uniref:Uncharacterized protein n=3 Tax=Sinorhizobium TaxID=28105 RepID=I3XG66_SINF2|nr:MULTISPECIES: hypothetical protein [Sinorhizobium]AFL54872.1 hypothetical protein USDA257_p01550 [Sinorhizobium fredii USDA 257]AWI62350.1 hypothetical protein AB395_00006727 [Sinorhizobium fredii CCBAU 45436]KSV90120.1 hypothetical protein N181_12865 [Sinorhizobium fredii USDA 205]MQX07607.1 hypothetical protein [Sinorhizobium fredii]OAP35593.1 hypothetical protein AU381_11805 [Sinorhizobium glycinis]